MYQKFLVSVALILIQCSSPKQEEATSADSLAVNTEISETPVSQEYTSPVANTAELESFIEYPFETDQAELIKILDEDAVMASLDSAAESFEPQLFEESTKKYGLNFITFKIDSSFVIMAGKAHQEAVGADVVCSADIKSPKFRFNKGVSIGMSKNDFLKQFHIADSLVVADASAGKSYFEKEQPHGVGFTNSMYRIKIWFTDNAMSRVQYEIYPCIIETFE